MNSPLQPTMSFRQRLGYIMLGLAIGLVIVGMIVSARQQAMRGQPGQNSGPAQSP